MWTYTLDVTQTDSKAGEKEVSDIKEITRKNITLGQINNANGDEYELNHNGARFNIFEHESGEVDVLLGNYRWSDVLNNDTVEAKEIVENKESIISHTNAIGNDNQVNIVLTGTNITTGETVLNIHAEEQKLNAAGKSNITEEYRPALPGQSTGEVRNPKPSLCFWRMDQSLPGEQSTVSKTGKN